VNSLALSPNGAHLYATSIYTVSHFRLDSSGNPTFGGCVGNLAGCAPTAPAGALDGAFGLAVSWAGGDLYATSWWGSYGAVSHFRFDATGNPVFLGCVGDYPGCATTTPKGALDGADGVAVSADGANLYATADLANDVSHFTIAGFA
jgi:sugar lactone lactonase YvrE